MQCLTGFSGALSGSPPDKVSKVSTQLRTIVVQIDLDNEDNEAQDKGSQDLYTSNKPAVKTPFNSDSDSDLEYRSSIKRSALDHVTMP